MRGDRRIPATANGYLHLAAKLTGLSERKFLHIELFPGIIDRNVVMAGNKMAGSLVTMTTLNTEHLILIIDDEEAVREAVSDILGFANIRVLVAADGALGIELFRVHYQQIDLVLLDLSMPGLNGADTFQELRKIDPNARVVLSSGYDETEATRRFVGQGLTGFLQKPYNMKNLVHKVEEYLGSAQ